MYCRVSCVCVCVMQKYRNKQKRGKTPAGGWRAAATVHYFFLFFFVGAPSRRDDHGMEQTSRWARLAGVVRLPLTARPAPKDLSGGSAPYFGCDGALHAVVHSGRSSSATSSRDTFGERAKNSDSTAVRPAVGAPGEWDILNILLLQDTKVGTMVLHFALKHGGRAVRSSANGVWRGDTHKQKG